MLSHADIIAAFGGKRGIAEAADVDAEVATHWSKRGIPAKYWLAIEAAAHERKLAVTADDLRKLSPLKKPTPRAKRPRGTEPESAA